MLFETPVGFKRCRKHEQIPASCRGWGVLGSALWQLWGQRKATPVCRARPRGSSDTPCTRLGRTAEHTKAHRGRRSECSFKIRGFFSSVLTESTGQTHRLQVNELPQKPAQGDRSLRSEIRDKKPINRLFKVNGILLCVTLNGALNLFAV